MTEPANKPPAIANESPVVLRARGLRKSFGGHRVLDGIDVELRRGQVVLLDGANGSGKTTLINILTGNLEPDAGEIFYQANGHSKSFRFPAPMGQRINLFHPFTPDGVARLGFGRSWQDGRLFGSMNLRDNIAVACSDPRATNPIRALFSSSNSTSGEAEAAAVLSRLGMGDRASSSGDMISLGQSKRIAIARAVAGGAKVLFLDEPLAGLDRAGIQEVLGMLRELVEQHQLTLVIVEHAFNQTHLRDLVTDHWHLEDGELTINATNLSQQESTSTPEWFQILSNAADEIITESLPRGAKLTRFRILGRYKPEPVLEVKDLVIRRGNHKIIGQESGFSLTINEGEIAVLQAPNGWGKSTLFSAAVGAIKDFDGEISLRKEAVSHQPMWTKCQQRMIAVPSLTLAFNTLMVCEVSRIAKCGRNLLFSASNTFTSMLSGGQIRNLALSIAIERSGHQSLLLLDEPMTGLDSIAARHFFEDLLASGFGSCLILLPKSRDDLND